MDVTEYKETTHKVKQMQGSVVLGEMHQLKHACQVWAFPRNHVHSFGSNDHLQNNVGIRILHINVSLRQLFQVICVLEKANVTIHRRELVNSRSMID